MSQPPRVLIIGDSISIGYTPLVAKLLAGQASVDHNPGNAQDSANVLANLPEWLTGNPADVIHLNCGLHDIKRARDSRVHQVPLEAYRANLGGIVEQLQATTARLIWATSTPVIEARHNAVKDFDRHNADVEAYNAAADEVVRAAGIHVTDLHAALLAEGIEMMLSDDGVHMTEGGSSVLAGVVAAAIRKLLGQQT